jgi:hypothetical protein
LFTLQQKHGGQSQHGEEESDRFACVTMNLSRWLGRNFIVAKQLKKRKVVFNNSESNLHKGIDGHIFMAYQI